MKNKLSKLCYFRKMNNDQKKAILQEFENTPYNGKKEEVDTYKQFKARVLTDFDADGFKIYMMVLNCITITILAILPLMFHFDGILFGVLVYACYALYAVMGVSIIVGLVSKKIRISKYKAHICALLIQILLTVADLIYILFEIAKALEGF